MVFETNGMMQFFSQCSFDNIYTEDETSNYSRNATVRKTKNLFSAWVGVLSQNGCSSKRVYSVARFVYLSSRQCSDSTEIGRDNHLTIQMSEVSFLIHVNK